MKQKRDFLKKLTNTELDDLLDKADWCDKELLKEYDDRLANGRVKLSGPIPQEQIEEFVKIRYKEKRIKKAS